MPHLIPSPFARIFQAERYSVRFTESVKLFMKWRVVGHVILRDTMPSVTEFADSLKSLNRAACFAVCCGFECNIQNHNKWLQCPARLSSKGRTLTLNGLEHFGGGAAFVHGTCPAQVEITVTVVFYKSDHLSGLLSV